MLADRIDPERVSFINPGFHLEERERHARNDIFLRNAALLLAKQFRLLVSLVATPDSLARFEKAVDLLAPIGVVPIPKAIRGLYAGKHYPAAYAAVDKSRFRHFAALAWLSQTAIQTVSERPTVDMLHDDKFLDGMPVFTGQSCEAGRSFVKMDPTGEAFRCGTSESLGNVRRGTFARRARPAPCDTNYCPYFCQKYAKKKPPPGQMPIWRQISNYLRV